MSRFYPKSPYLWVVLVTLGLGELFLRLSGQLDSYPERIGQAYTSPYNNTPLNPEGLYLRAPHARYKLVQPEFEHEMNHNSMGLRGPELPHPKEAQPCYKILALGDSFTEGVGVTWTEGWVPQYRKFMPRMDTCIKVMGAGIGGSDPLLAWQLYNRKLANLKPDYLILTINYSDVLDVGRRGGWERFDAQGNLQPKPGPVWEPLFQHCYWVRFFALIVFRFDWNLTPPWNRAQEMDKAIQALALAARKFQETQESNGGRFLLVIIPQYSEMRENGWINGWVDQLNPLLKGIPHYSLMPGLQKELAQGLPLNSMYYPVDGHFTALGYRWMAEQIARQHP